MKNKKFLLAPLLLTSLALGGCASTPKQVNLNLRYVNANSAYAGNDSQAQSQIAHAASSVDQSLSQLSAIDIATHPTTNIGKPMAAGGGMSRYATISWYGPVEPVLRTIARKAGYQLNVIGSEPAIAVLVNVSAQSQPLSVILRNVTYQVHAKARVAVYPNKKIIELRYLGN